MSNEARDIRISETITTFVAICQQLRERAMQSRLDTTIENVAAQLTAIVMRENGENMRTSQMCSTLYTLQRDVAQRIDQIRELADSIAAHVLESGNVDSEVRLGHIRKALMMGGVRSDDAELNADLERAGRGIDPEDR